MFEIGEKVICINSSMKAETVAELRMDIPNWVKENEKYTIRGFHENNGIVLGVLLEEIRNPIKYFKLINKRQEGAFAQWRFRKLNDSEIEKKEEINQEILQLL
jgi:hypothetical protein